MSSPMLALDHVQVAAPTGCEAAARAFYSDLLGLVEIAKPAALATRGGCWFRVGQHELHVGVEEPFHAAAKAHPAFGVGSLEGLRGLADRLTEAGATVAWADPDEIPGRERFHVSDPFGNRLEFLA